MFLSRDNLSASSADRVEYYEKVHNNLVERTKQLNRANHELAHQIAERQRVEEALRQTEQKYRSIFENAVEGIFQTTPDGYYLACNPALARIYGYESADALLKTLTNIGRQLYIDPNRRQEFIERLYTGDVVSDFESQVYRKDGSIIWISENARAVRAEDGTLLYYEGFVTDITQRKLAEEASQRAEAQLRAKAEQLKQALTKLQQTQAQLIHNEKMCNLGQLVAGVAHEINNPVNFVCGNLIPATQYVEDLLDLLRLYTKHYPQPAAEIQARAEAIDLEFLVEDFPKTLSSMQLGADRIRQIVQSLRSFSRIDESQMTQVDIHKGIDSTLLIINNRLKPKGDNPGIAIVKEYGELPLIKGYAGLLNQVFMNLLCNAVDALEDCPPKLCTETDSEEHYKAVNGKGSSDHQACYLRNRSGTPARRVGCVSVSDRETLANSPSPTPTSTCAHKTDIVPMLCPRESPKVIRICTELIEGDALDGKTTDPRVVIRIIDNGPGMPEDIKAQIFDPFFTTKPVGKGTGLGLSISYQIVVEKHGGQLQCILAPNQGTEFRIEIPIQP
ncbi:PAS domain S-box protein [Microcoleus sp. FACHB-53]|nr:PAS domain S-box protein [Microcoleus sp. FACHB-53]